MTTDGHPLLAHASPRIRPCKPDIDIHPYIAFLGYTFKLNKSLGSKKTPELG